MPAWRQVLEEPPTDGWGNEIRYEFPGKKNPASFDLRSAGRDGVIGTADDIIK
ncbi:MAG TPA: type II secretion system protein GspG [Phycisphaerae bacterium]|nr:type II secretion system protein GspG [Phycisphaerae bacterium]